MKSRSPGCRGDNELDAGGDRVEAERELLDVPGLTRVMTSAHIFSARVLVMYTVRMTSVVCRTVGKSLY